MGRRVSVALSVRRTFGLRPVHCLSSKTGSPSIKDGNRPPFDLHLAVLLAGFAFEAYSSPPVSFLQFSSQCRFLFSVPKSDFSLP